MKIRDTKISGGEIQLSDYPSVKFVSCTIDSVTFTGVSKEVIFDNCILQNCVLPKDFEQFCRRCVILTSNIIGGHFLIQHKQKGC